MSVVMSIFGYSCLIVMTAKGTGEGLSISTFGLWSALAWITSFTMLSQKANPAVPIIYGVGATTTTIILLFKGRYGWSALDTVIAILVVLCVILWLTSGPRLALILSVVAAAIATIPFVVLTWKSPEMSPIIPNSAFLVANYLAFVSAKAWTIEDRLYSGVNVVVCSLLIIPWLFR